MNLTRRAKILAALAILAALMFGYTTAGYCWDGHGYSSCIDITGPVSK